MRMDDGPVYQRSIDVKSVNNSLMSVPTLLARAVQLTNLVWPTTQSFPHLGQVSEAIIDTGHTAQRPILMVQNSLSHMWRDTELSHAGRNRPTDVVQRPIRRARQRMQLLLPLAEATDRLCQRMMHHA